MTQIPEINETPESTSWLEKPLSTIIPKCTIEFTLITLIIILAFLSRFIGLGDRVMSHDEVNHMVPSYDLYEGRGYRHDPVTHGPLQFHLVAATFFLIGDSDFSGRASQALFSVAAVAFVLIAFRRYLGKTGTLIAGILFLISPYMLYYGRYARNEPYIELLGAMLIYAVLRYLDRGDKFSLYLLTASLVLHYTAKETAYIYSAQLLLFLVVIFIQQLIKTRWTSPMWRSKFQLHLILTAASLAIFSGIGVYYSFIRAGSLTAPAMLVNPIGTSTLLFIHIPMGLFLIFTLAGLIMIVKDLNSGLPEEHHVLRRYFDLLVLSGTLVLPLLTAGVLNIMGINPLDYSTTGMIATGLILFLIFLFSAAIGAFWNLSLWLGNAILFYGVFAVLYTTFFTNGQGFFTGMVGGFGYWLSQQGVERGSQPWFYFLLIQVPIYEFLGLIGTVLAGYYGFKNRLFSQIAGLSLPDQSEQREELPAFVLDQQKTPVLGFLIFWAVTSFIAYSIAGEKMPWLTVHIALGLLLSAGWGLGYLLDTTDWRRLFSHTGWLALALTPAFLLSFGNTLGMLLGNQPPFQGTTLDQLQTTATFLVTMVTAILTAAGLAYTLRDWEWQKLARLLLVGFFAIMAVLTARAAYRAAFINYDLATEYLVYAHAARGPKDILEQVEEISQRITRGTDLEVAYDNDGLYPYWWYFRHYPNHIWYQDEPTRDLQDVPIIIASQTNYSRIEPIVQDDYTGFEYTRLWWPNMDYMFTTWQTIWEVISDPQMRTAVYNIWLDRDYSLYAELTGNQTLTIENWDPSNRFRMYIRNDILQEIWNYGAMPSVGSGVDTDPYAAGMIDISPDITLDNLLLPADSQLSFPRGLAIAADGSIFVADAGNHRILHISESGELLRAWGSFANIAEGSAPAGTLNEPWGIAVAPDGSVWVADTWNHRVQHYTASGAYINGWGIFGQGDTPTSFYGPRGIAIDAEGRVYITDTGNKRVVVFDSRGNYITQFGAPGLELGSFDEPIGIAIDTDGDVYVADTWNQRIQVFTRVSDEPLTFAATNSWSIDGWSGQSLENKPFIALTNTGNLLVVDPEGYRVLEFSSDGTYLRGWGYYSPNNDGFGLPMGVGVAEDGGVWISDSANHRIMRFTLPELAVQQVPEGLPAFPVGATLIYNPQDGFLYDEESRPAYRFDELVGLWSPFIPPDIALILPEDAVQQSDASGSWWIQSVDGNPLYLWDAAALQWVTILDVPTPTATPME